MTGLVIVAAILVYMLLSILLGMFVHHVGLRMVMSGCQLPVIQ